MAAAQLPHAPGLPDTVDIRRIRRDLAARIDSMLNDDLFPLPNNHPYAHQTLWQSDIKVLPCYFIALVVDQALDRFRSLPWDYIDLQSCGQLVRALQDAQYIKNHPSAIHSWTPLACAYEDVLNLCRYLHNLLGGRCMLELPADFPRHLCPTLNPLSIHGLYLTDVQWPPAALPAGPSTSGLL